MSYPAFAYTGWMHLILFVLSCATTCLFYWLTTDIVLTIYGVKASRGRRMMFVFWTGLVLNQLWIFGIYVLGGLKDFSPTLYQLITFPNPIFALLFYFIGIKTLRLSSYRSIHLMRHVYIYCIIILLVYQVISRTFFAQIGPYNYLLDAMSLCACTIVNTAAYVVIIAKLRRTDFLVRLNDSTHVRSRKVELSISFLQACVIYIFVLIMPMIVSSHIISYLIAAIILTLFLMLSVLLRYKRVINTKLENKDAYIGTLTRSIDRFSGIKHDFYNMLQTYSGYIELGNLTGLKEYHEELMGLTLLAGDQIDLNQCHMQENPALVSLLIKKQEHAETCGVHLRVSVQCSLEDLYISDIDICRVVGNLLDNAIDAASASLQRRILFSVEQKLDLSKLIVITNSTKDEVNLNTIAVKGVTTKEGHSGLGLTQVRDTLSKYPQCTLQLSYYNREFSVYIESRPTMPPMQEETFFPGC